MTTRVLLADDQPLVRAGLRMLIADTDDLELVGEAGTGTAAVELARSLAPDVVVMDLRMPELDGIEATRRITAYCPTTFVTILSTFDADEDVYGALRAGASGFLVKDMSVDDILAGIRVVAAGDAMIAPGVMRRLIRDFTLLPARQRHRRVLTNVTERELEVLELVGRGLSNAEIAAELVNSVATARSTCRPPVGQAECA